MSKEKFDVPISNLSRSPAQLLTMSDEEVAAITVDCGNCPVNMFCQAGVNGSGTCCADCGGTAVLIDKESLDEVEDVYVMDCASHSFKNDDPVDATSGCVLCDGDIVQTSVRDPAVAPLPRIHVVLTANAKVKWADRKPLWQSRAEYWRKYFASKAKKG